MERLTGKVCLITGGARGQGAAEAKMFAAQGAKVWISDVLDEEGEALAAELQIQYRHLDVREEKEWQTIVDEIVTAEGQLDVLINNAGTAEGSAFADTTLESYRRVTEVNQTGVFLGMRAVVEAMTAAGGGSIINISSIDGMVGSPGIISYIASKWAVRGMTKSAAIEMGKFGIRVNSVHPGGIYTAMHGSDFLTEEDASKFYDKQAIPRVGLPKEVAALTAFLASDEATYSTGSEFVADGGWNAGLVNTALPQL